MCATEEAAGAGRGVQLVHDAGTHTVTAAGYLLYVRDGVTGAVLADPDGRAWSRLSLLASVNRVDGPDESYDLQPLRITETTVDGAPAVELELRTASSAWRTKSVVLRCLPDRLELHARVTGSGRLSDVQLLGGRAVLNTGACGRFRSSVAFASVFDPAPTEPVQFVRPASAAASLGVLGDAGPGRLHGVFCPPPLCLVLGRSAADGPTHVPDGDWFALGVVAPTDALRFTELRYSAEDGGFLLELDYDGQTEVAGEFRTPTLVLRPAPDPWAALAAYRDDHVRRGFAPDRPAARPARWWAEPLFCGWGAQCASAAEVHGLGDVAGRAADLSRRALYDAWLDRLAGHGVVPGTVVVDDRWEAVYGSGEPDPDRWPDLRGWIADRHAAGQRVVLWWKAWDAAGLPPEECVLTPSGAVLAADPGSPAYLARLARTVTRLLGPDRLDADGLKVDFTQRAPAGACVRRPGAPAGAAWGISALHALLGTIHRAAKAAKPDALVITHSPHPAFAGVTDMLRVNDLLVHDPAGHPVPPADQLAVRHRVIAQTMPHHLIDTDQWPIADAGEWRAYVRRQGELGVPSLYYAEYLHRTEYLHFAERVDRRGDELTADDFALVARCWAEYRARLGPDEWAG